MILSDTQTMIRDTVRAFAQDRLAPKAAEFEAAGGYPRELFGTLAELGLMGVNAPLAYGGAGLDYVSYALALIEVAAADGALSTILSVHNAPVIAALLNEGSTKQKDRFLPDLCSGRKIGAFALTEAEAGSNAATLATRALRFGGGYTLEGSKQFVTSGSIAGVALVFAVSDPTAGKRGISAFIVPTDRPGYIVDRVESKLGQTASDTCAVRLDAILLEDDLRLGVEGDGYRIALANLEAGRIGIAAQSVGMAQAALELAVRYSKERRSFGKAIINHQAVGFRLADLATKLEAARHLVLYAASLKDAGRHCLTEASMAKLFASEMAETVCSGAIQTLGGYGYLKDFGIEKIYRDVRVCQIYEGTSDIQRMVIARSF
jgi:alkylation response protein AidB-like acyl-CoA dehydrogenase